MPLKIQSDITIWSPPPSPVDETFATPMDDMAPAMDFLEEPHSLPVPLSIQEKRNWCWAACVQMIMHFFNHHTVRQCEVASLFFNTNSCADPDSFNTARDPEEIERIFAVQQPSVACRHLIGTISFEGIQHEIDDRRSPVGVAVLWFRPDGVQRGGHILLVKGWRTVDDRPFVKVNDPWYGPGDLPFSRLKSYYGPDNDGLDGVWRHTWTNIRR